MPMVMLPDPTGAGWMNDIERRLRALETAPSLTQSSIKQGALQILDANNKVVIQLGLQADGTYAVVAFDPSSNEQLRFGQLGGGVTGLRLRTAAAGQVVEQLETTGQRYPILNLVPACDVGATFAGTTVRPGTTSASLVPIWRCDFYCAAPSVAWDVSTYANANTMDFTVTIVEPGATEQTIRSITGINTNTTDSPGSIAIPSNCLLSGTDPVGRYLTMKFKARKTAGAGQVDIAMNAAPQNKF